MSTAVTLNPFQLLRDNEADDPEVISATIKKPEPEAAPAPAVTPEKPKKTVTQGSKENNPVSDTGRGGRGRGARGGRTGRGGGRGRGSGQDDEGTDIAVPEGNDSNRDLGGGRGGRAGRGGRGRGRRDFDRHDGTGRAHEGMKRGGAGKGNWGVEGEDGEQLNAVASLEGENTAAVPPVDGDAAVEYDDAADKEPEVPPEPEVELISLEAYEKMQAEKRAGLNKVGTVASVDTAQFQGMATVERPKVEESDVLAPSATKAKRERQRKEREGKNNVLTDLGFSTREEGGRGERRGRGDRRGGGRDGGRDGGRGGGRSYGGRGGGQRSYEDAEGGEGSYGGRGRGRGGRGRGRSSYNDESTGGQDGAAEEGLEDAGEDAQPSYSSGRGRGGYGRSGRGRGAGRGGDGGYGGGYSYRDSGASTTAAPDLSLGDDNFPSLS